MSFLLVGERHFHQFQRGKLSRSCLNGAMRSDGIGSVFAATS
jgi:hypothetical protein